MSADDYTPHTGDRRIARRALRPADRLPRGDEPAGRCRRGARADPAADEDDRARPGRAACDQGAGARCPARSPRRSDLAERADPAGVRADRPQAEGRARAGRSRPGIRSSSRSRTAAPRARGAPAGARSAGRSWRTARSSPRSRSAPRPGSRATTVPSDKASYRFTITTEPGYTVAAGRAGLDRDEGRPRAPGCSSAPSPPRRYLATVQIGKYVSLGMDLAGRSGAGAASRRRSPNGCGRISLRCRG